MLACQAGSSHFYFSTTKDTKVTKEKQRKFARPGVYSGIENFIDGIENFLSGIDRLYSAIENLIDAIENFLSRIDRFY